MKLKKLIVITSVILFVFLTYYLFENDKLNYVSLGDSVARGQNPYGEIGYGYTDYFKDYLKKENKLNNYITFAVSGYKTKDIINDINNNIKIKKDNKTFNIKEELRESDIVTISIGANDFIGNLKIKDLNLNNTDKYCKQIDKIFIDIDKTLKLIRNYAKKDIILIGYYNPFPILFKSNEEEIDLIFNYADRKYYETCNKYNIEYISIYNLFKNNNKFLPNPFDIHPNINGYKAISNRIIEVYKNKN